MTTDDDDFNGSDVEPLHELVEEAPVTRAATLANAFMEGFFHKFAEAELKDDKKFLLSLDQFDTWLIDRGDMPAPSDDDEDSLAADGRSARRNYLRRMINRAAAFGKTVWPPFSIEVHTVGKIYEVRLLDYYADKIPTELTASMKRYLVNKTTHWGQISAFMHEEKTRKKAPEAVLRFYGIERMIDLTLKNAVQQLQNLNEEVQSAHKEARLMIASLDVNA